MSTKMFHVKQWDSKYIRPDNGVEIFQCPTMGSKMSKAKHSAKISLAEQ